MLTTTGCRLLTRLSMDMNSMLSTPPAMAYMMVLNPPNKSPLSSTFKIISTQAVGRFSIYTAKISTELLRPSLMPGTPATAGSRLST